MVTRRDSLSSEEMQLIKKLQKAQHEMADYIERHYPKRKAAKPEQQAHLGGLRQKLYEAWDALNDFRQRQHDSAEV